jgi:hypothetical protein
MSGELPSLPEPGDLFPTAEELLEIQSRQRRDIDKINALFAEQGEPPFDFSKPVRPIAAPDRKALADTLFRLFLLAYREANGPAERPERVAPAAPDPKLRQRLASARRQAEAVEAELVAVRSRPFLNIRNWAYFNVCRLLASAFASRPGLAESMRRRQSLYDPRRPLAAAPGDGTRGALAAE